MTNGRAVYGLSEVKGVMANLDSGLSTSRLSAPTLAIKGAAQAWLLPPTSGEATKAEQRLLAFGLSRCADRSERTSRWQHNGR